MARRKHELLTDVEREHLIGILRDRDQLARLYTFESNDIDIIGNRREKRKLLGVALQLALLRHPGASLAQLPKDFPPFTTVQHHFYRMRNSGLLDLIHEALAGVARIVSGRDEEPTAGIIDSQSVKTT